MKRVIALLALVALASAVFAEPQAEKAPPVYTKDNPVILFAAMAGAVTFLQWAVYDAKEDEASTKQQ
jgi:hypothetical protein